MSKEPCPCGRPFRLEEHIEGRCDDILELEGIHSTHKRIHPIAFRSSLGVIHELRQYQVVYKKDGLHFNLVPREVKDMETLAPKVEYIMKKKFEMDATEAPLLVKYTPDQKTLDQCRNLGKRLAENLMR
jgi:phenylacetate-coenzyme A ligase PaaK-like adenylate-forming protein